jgi:transposase
MATVTVLSGPERRRRWASSEKASIVEKSLRPGAMVTAVALRHDVHPNLLHHFIIGGDKPNVRWRAGKA